MPRELYSSREVDFPLTITTTTSVSFTTDEEMLSTAWLLGFLFIGTAMAGMSGLPSRSNIRLDSASCAGRESYLDSAFSGVQSAVSLRHPETLALVFPDYLNCFVMISLWMVLTM